MSEKIVSVLHAHGTIRIEREGAETPVSIPASGILQVSTGDGASITLGDGGATQLAGVEYLDENGDTVDIETNHTDAKSFRVAPGVTITVLHNRTVDLLANPIPAEQRILTSSGKDFALSTINTQAFYAYAATVTGFRWSFADHDNYDADPSDWAGAAPDNIADAITRMATALAGLLGEPIP